MRIGKYSYQTAMAALLLAGSVNALANTQLFKEKLINCNPWNGFYISGQLGSSWNTTDWNYTNANFFNTSGATLLGDDFSSSNWGKTVGANAGFNYQTGNLLLGIDGGYVNTDLNETNPNPFFPATESFTTYLHYITTAKARVGYALKKWLFNVNGGWAGGSVFLSIQDPGAAVKANTTQWANGWTVGTGIDYKVSKHVALGVAYDYVKLSVNNATVTCPSCGTGVGLGTPTVDGDVKTQLVSARLSYLFG